MSITAISFYWRNDTPSFVTWRSRLATAPDTPRCIVIYGGQFTGGFHPPNQFVPQIVSLLPCSSYITDCLFFQRTFSFIGSPDKCHSSIFNALIIRSHCKCMLASVCCALVLPVVDRCSEPDLNYCDPVGGQCNRLPKGGYNCSCVEGYSGDGFTCEGKFF